MDKYECSHCGKHIEKNEIYTCVKTTVLNDGKNRNFSCYICNDCEFNLHVYLTGLDKYINGNITMTEDEK